MKICLRVVIGVMGVHIACMVCVKAAVARRAPVFEINEPCSNNHGSIKDKLIACTGHAHALFYVDNGGVYYDLDTAIYNTVYAPTIYHYCKSCDGQRAYEVFVSQYTSKEV